MKKTHKKHVALLTTLAVIVCTLFYTNTAKADTENSWDSSDVVKVSKCTVNGTERILTLYSDGSLFFKVKENGYSTILPDALDIGFDKLGTIYCIDSDNIIRWWNYDLAADAPGFHSIFILVNNEEIGIDNVKELILDEDNNYVIGFRTFSGETYPTLREYPKVCVNLQTGVRYNYSVWRFLLWQEEKVTHHRKQQCAK